MSNIRVHTSNIGVHTNNIRLHTSNIRVHTNIYGNTQVIYEYTGYIRIPRSNIRWQEGNKHEMYHFFLYISSYMSEVHVLHTHASARKCHTRARTTHMCLRHIHTFSVRVPYARHTRTNKPERWCDMMRRCASNIRRLRWKHTRFSACKCLIELFSSKW